MVFADIKFSSWPPIKTPNPAANTSAAEEPKNTIQLFTFASDAKSMVASCVLSPISAKKTVTKMVKNACRFIHQPFFKMMLFIL